jgi:altronate dehydratase small subunit
MCSTGLRISGYWPTAEIWSDEQDLDGLGGKIKGQNNHGEGSMRRNAIVIKHQDNVATAIQDIPAGQIASAGIEDRNVSIKVVQEIHLGHKLALCHIGKGEDILKYGTVIGFATHDINPGEHVHVHNVESKRGRGDLV